MFKGKFEDIVLSQDGFLRGPFGSALKKSLFVSKAENTYKVYEQSVVLQQDKSLGNYYISREYFEKEMSRFEVKSGDFLVSCSGVNYGAIFQLKGEIEKGVINQALLRIRLNQELVDANYFLYYFKAYIVKKIIGGTGDSTIPNFPPMAVVKAINIELPDIEIQKKVGKVLAEIDDKIQINNMVSNELESMAKNIYDYWFLQFDFPDENGKPYKSSGGKMVWNEELKREIPAGWGIKKIQDVLTSIPVTKKYKSDEYENGNKYPIIDQSSKYICGYTDNKNDLLNLEDCIIFGDHTKHIKYVNFAFARGADGTQIINSSNSSIPNYILYRQILNMDLVSQGYSRYFKFLKDKYIIIPHKKVSDSFMKNINISLNKMKHIISENKELENMRDFLLPLLMNGQIGFN
ncbi:MAG: restriction endonuclease subunit S [Clostridium sp.]|nr:restriction endonuclease subunit S [Clostridium sp.]